MLLPGLRSQQPRICQLRGLLPRSPDRHCCELVVLSPPCQARLSITVRALTRGYNRAGQSLGAVATESPWAGKLGRPRVSRALCSASSSGLSITLPEPGQSRCGACTGPPTGLAGPPKRGAAGAYSPALLLVRYSQPTLLTSPCIPLVW